MELTTQEKHTLLAIARDSIHYALRKKERAIDKNRYTVTDSLRVNSGAFVTLEKNNRLRGCVGYIEGVGTLFETVAEAAVAAALHDSRFPEVSPEELPSIEIEISVLSLLKRVEDVDEIRVGKDGLLIQSGFNHGLLLPQVPAEYGWERQTFLEQTCVKAGLPRDAWKWNDTQIRSFTADVFGESDLDLNA